MWQSDLTTQRLDLLRYIDSIVPFLDINVIPPHVHFFGFWKLFVRVHKHAKSDIWK